MHLNEFQMRPRERITPTYETALENSHYKSLYRSKYISRSIGYAKLYKNKCNPADTGHWVTSDDILITEYNYTTGT